MKNFIETLYIIFAVVLMFSILIVAGTFLFDVPIIERIIEITNIITEIEV